MIILSNTEIQSDDGSFRVILDHIGEGMSGNYDPGDPDDQPLIRFYVDKMVDGEWQQFDDASYCTRLPADNLSEETLLNATRYFFLEVSWAINNGCSLKKQCERLSWTGPEDIIGKEFDD